LIRGIAAAVFAIFAAATPSRAADNVCVTCHLKESGKASTPAKEFQKSIHAEAGVTCVDCHGGNPKDEDKAMDSSEGFTGAPAPKDIPKLCSKCHSDVNRMKQYKIRTDQYAEYKTSVHGKLLESGDENVATCASCHGAHMIRKIDDPASSVFHTNVPETCGKCHADKARMAKYKIPTDQLEKYRESYHGKILYGKISGKNPSLVPNCASCHGNHGATPPGVGEVVNVCGSCHGNTAKYFQESPHFAAIQTKGVPKCINCHGNHDIQFPTTDMLEGDSPRKCGSCHALTSGAYNIALGMKHKMAETDELIKTAHGEMEIAEKSGRNVEPLMILFTEAQNKLVEAGPVLHTLNIAKFEGVLQEGANKLQQVNAEVEKIRGELRFRKKVMLAADVLIGTIIFLLLLKLTFIKIDRRSAGK